ncbi:MAG: hypothetical protein CSA32_03565 [Desulfobulbus propionicus]|nr:MAG: hypothetical protein CSA32_03565 [Desulfobulbus propionicus]
MLGNLFKLLFWQYLRPAMSKLPIWFINSLIHTFNFVQVSVSPGKTKKMAEELKNSGLAEGKIFPLKRVYGAFYTQRIRWAKKCLLPAIHSNTVDHYLPVDGLSFLTSALSQGNGAIMLNPHFGPFLFALPALGHRNFSVHQVAMISERDIFGVRTGLRKLVYDAKFQAIEKKIPASFINASDNPMVIRTVIQTLNNNQVVFFSSTGRAGKSWKKMPFLGRTACFSLIPFRLALKTGTPLLPVFALNANPITRIVIDSPLQVSKSTTAEDLLQQYIFLLEAYVREYPTNFGYFLYEMRVQAGKDDHPFFDDYKDISAPGLADELN